jgi:hypothetical protein
MNFSQVMIWAEESTMHDKMAEWQSGSGKEGLL